MSATPSAVPPRIPSLAVIVTSPSLVTVPDANVTSPAVMFVSPINLSPSNVTSPSPAPPVALIVKAPNALPPVVVESVPTSPPVNPAPVDVSMVNAPLLVFGLKVPETMIEPALLLFPDSVSSRPLADVSPVRLMSPPSVDSPGMAIVSAV